MTQSTHDACPDGLGSGAESVACELRRAAKAESMLLSALLTEAGVYPGQELLLQALWQEGPQSQAQLAAALDIDPSTVTKTLQRLERNGLVARCPSEKDKRAHVVSTTSSGDALRDKVLQAIAAVHRRAVDGMTEDEVRELSRLLAMMTQNLCAGRSETR